MKSAVPPDAAPRDDGSWAAIARTAPATTILVAVNVAIFVAQAAFSGGAKALMGMPARTMLVFGANDSTWTTSDGRIETLVTSCFLHFSLLHLGFNMLALKQVGELVERAAGWARMVPLYLAAGAFGSAASAMWGRAFGERLSAGASGAICGLIGAALVLGYRTQGARGPLTRAMARWLLIIVAFGVLGHSLVDNAAHFGGAAGGAIVALSWRRGVRYSAGRMAVVLVLSLATVLGSATTVVVRDLGDPYLFMTEDERLEAARRALGAGRCDKARHAIARARRINPADEEIAALARTIRERCATPADRR